MDLLESLRIRGDQVEAVCGAGRHFLGVIQEGLDLRYGLGAGEEITRPIDRFLGHLEAAFEGLKDAADAYYGGRLALSQARAERRQLAREQKVALMDLRDLVLGVHGKATVDWVGLGGRIPKQFEQVNGIGRFVLERMDDPRLPATRPEVVLNLELRLAPIRERAVRLEALMDAVAGHKTALVMFRADYHQAVRAFDRAYADAADLVTLALRSAGKDSLMRKVRPRQRRRRRVTAGEAGEASDSGDEVA